jgi:hypothetical protein
MIRNIPPFFSLPPQLGGREKNGKNCFPLIVGSCKILLRPGKPGGM